MTYPDLELELNATPHLMNKLTSYEYAKNFFAALCNTSWKKEGYDYSTKEPWSVTWRIASDIAFIFHDDVNFVECSGSEDEIDKEVQQDLFELGWTWEPTNI